MSVLTHKMNKKGYAMSWDALLSLMLIFMAMGGLLVFQYTNMLQSERRGLHKLHFIAEDALDVLDKKGVLEEIGDAWSRNNTPRANQTARMYLDEIIPEYIGYEFRMDNDIIARREGWTPEGGPIDKTHSTRLISGYAENKNWRGWAGRAWLIENKTHVINTVSRQINSAQLTTLNLTWQDYHYAIDPTFKENKTIWLTIPLGLTVTNATLDIRGSI